jgi:hypothetical protein
MFAKLAAVLLHAKSGAIPAVLLLAAASALASATVANGVTPAPCTAVSLSPSPASPQVTGTTVLWTASATGCAAPQFRFMVFHSSTGWIVGQDWSASPSFSWSTGSLVIGDYLVQVLAKAEVSGTTQALSPILTYTLTTGSTLTPCTAAAISPNLTSPQAVGTTVVWTATATGCATPQFRFMVWNASTGWVVGQDWSASPTFSWNTTSLATGNYFVQGWARAGTSGVFQAVSPDVGFTLMTASTAPCTAASLSPNPTSPQAVGTTVLWTASATGCSTPQFRFMVWNSSTGWVVGQDWSTSPTFSWTTGSLAAGNYFVQAWARAGTSGAFQAVSPDVGFTLTTASTAPCTAVSLSANPASPRASGTTILWTASATGCTTPQFRFMVWNGTSWTLGQEWSTSPTFSWNTTGLAAGNYIVLAWARAGTSGDFQAVSPDVAFTLTAATTPPPSACKDEAAAIAFQVQRVNGAFTGFHTDLVKLRGLRDAAVLEKADRTLKAIRQGATKAIHATATAACKKDDDENDDENDGDHNDGEHNDNHDRSGVEAMVKTLSFVDEISSDEANDGHGQHLGITFTGTASAIADQAIAAMQVAFDAAKNAPVKTPKPTPTPKVESKGAKVSPTKSPDHNGQHRD